MPALDGTRGVAILLVIGGHYLGVDLFARAGVHLFFLLSGYLITGILVRELRATGTIRLGRFYWRRACRIVPAYALWLGITWLALGRPGDGGTMLALSTYTTNYWHIFGVGEAEPWTFVSMTQHAWSLAVEEQFYLLWPVALLGVGLHRAPRGLLAAGVVALSWAVLAALGGATEAYLTRAFEVEGVWLALGCYAGVRSEGRQWRGGVLAWRPLAWVGAISYPLYLWHFWGAWASFAIPLPFAGRVMLAVTLTTAMACVSYYGMERHILRWRDAQAAAGPAR